MLERHMFGRPRTLTLPHGCTLDESVSVDTKQYPYIAARRRSEPKSTSVEARENSYNIERNCAGQNSSTMEGTPDGTAVSSPLRRPAPVITSRKSSQRSMHQSLLIGSALPGGPDIFSGSKLSSQLDAKDRRGGRQQTQYSSHVCR